MFCKKCGATLNEADMFCEKCGASVNENTETKKKEKLPMDEYLALSKEYSKAKTKKEALEALYGGGLGLAGAAAGTLLFLFINMVLGVVVFVVTMIVMVVLIIKNNQKFNDFGAELYRKYLDE